MAKKSSSMLDLEQLAEELSGDDSKNESVTMDMPDEIEIIDRDPREILKENISRAFEILDLIRMNMKVGNYSARLFEVAGQLINHISSASKEIIQDENTKLALMLKEEYYRLKGDIPRTKEKIIVVTTREDLMKRLNNGENITKQIEGGFDEN